MVDIIATRQKSNNDIDLHDLDEIKIVMISFQEGPNWLENSMPLFTDQSPEFFEEIKTLIKKYFAIKR
jgi:hypothetical protein